MGHEVFIHNGEFIDDERSVLSRGNRSFQYGDGLFESIRIINGRIAFLGHHLQRLREGMKALRIKVPDHYTAEYFEGGIRQLMDHNGIEHGGRVRLTVYRDAGGAYLPDSNNPAYLLEVSPLEHEHYTLNKKGLLVGVFPDIKKQPDRLSRFKTTNGLLYVMASLHAREKELDDCFLVGPQDNIVEATSSNLFIVSNGVLYTPPLEDGCVGGVMRMQVINIALENRYTVYECSLRPQNILAADEVFLTNSVRGIQWVKEFKSKQYDQHLSARMVTKLNESVLSLKMDPQGSSPT